jgi:hypothetical protein
MTLLDAILTITLFGGYLVFAIGAILTARAIIDHVKRAKGRARDSLAPVAPSHDARTPPARVSAPGSAPDPGARLHDELLDGWRAGR